MTILSKIKIPQKAIEYHSDKLNEIVVRPLINDFPMVTKDGIYDKDPYHDRDWTKPYTGNELFIERSDNELYQDFIENHLEIMKSKDFYNLVLEFKKASKSWWKIYELVIDGIKLDLRNYLNTRYLKPNEIPAKYNIYIPGFTKRLIGWIIKGMKCSLEPDCSKYYYQEYYVNKINITTQIRKTDSIVFFNNVDGTLIIDIFDKKQSLNGLKEDMNNKLKKYMDKKINKTPFYKIYKQSLRNLVSATEHRNKIIKILKKNLNIHFYGPGNCPYLPIMAKNYCE